MGRTIRSYVKRGSRLSKLQHIKPSSYPFYFETALDGSKFFAPDFYGKKFFCDIGFGNGDALLHLASKNPNEIIIGIEVYDSGIGATIKKIKMENITNVYVINGDAMEILEKWIGPKFKCIRLLFPDPWPKKKHHKRRLVQSNFVEEAHRCLTSNGIVHFASDWNPYCEEVKNVFLRNNFQFSKKLSRRMRAERIPTKFELRGLIENRKSVDMVFEKNDRS